MCKAGYRRYFSMNLVYGQMGTLWAKPDLAKSLKGTGQIILTLRWGSGPGCKSQVESN